MHRSPEKRLARESSVMRVAHVNDLIRKYGPLDLITNVTVQNEIRAMFVYDPDDAYEPLVHGATGSYEMKCFKHN